MHNQAIRLLGRFPSYLPSTRKHILDGVLPLPLQCISAGTEGGRLLSGEEHNNWPDFWSISSLPGPQSMKPSPFGFKSNQFQRPVALQTRGVLEIKWQRRRLAKPHRGSQLLGDYINFLQPHCVDRINITTFVLVLGAGDFPWKHFGSFAQLNMTLYFSRAP